MIVIIANIIGLIDSITFIVGSKAKTIKRCMLIQAAGTPFSAIANVMLGSYSGALMNLLSGVRNIFKAYNVKSNLIFYLIALLQVVVGLKVNVIGIVGLLPIVASVSLTLAMIITKNKITLDRVLILNVILWLIHDLIVLNIASVVIRIISLTALSTNFIKK